MSYAYFYTNWISGKWKDHLLELSLWLCLINAFLEWLPGKACICHGTPVSLVCLFFSFFFFSPGCFLSYKSVQKREMVSRIHMISMHPLTMLETMDSGEWKTSFCCWALDSHLGFAFLCTLFPLVMDLGTQPALGLQIVSPTLPFGVLPLLSAAREKSTPCLTALFATWETVKSVTLWPWTLLWLIMWETDRR